MVSSLNTKNFTSLNFYYDVESFNETVSYSFSWSISSSLDNRMPPLRLIHNVINAKERVVKITIKRTMPRQLSLFQNIAAIQIFLVGGYYYYYTYIQNFLSCGYISNGG